MSYDFVSARQLEARINQYQSNAAARAAFDEGLQLISTFGMVNTFDLTSKDRDEYEIEQRIPQVLTGKPELDSCGADIPTVKGNYEREPIEFIPFAKRIALELCKSKCTRETFEEKFQKAEREAGASFGKVVEQLFWWGDSFNPGMTRVRGVEIFNAAGGDYENLDTKDPIEMANFFSMISHNHADPVFYMGPVMIELLGWRMLSNTGDTCNQVWTCMIDTLAQRFGETAAQTQARFVAIDYFDRFVGIDNANLATVYPTLMVIDRPEVAMGVSDSEIVYPAMAVNHDEVQAPRGMMFTAPQVYRYGSVKFVFNLIPLARVIARTGTRYGPNPAPTITVPAPL